MQEEFEFSYERRWVSGTSFELGHIHFRVVAGDKAPGDLKIQWNTPSGWVAIPMSVCAALTDFFVENEEHLKQYRPHWQQSGFSYFWGFLRKAVKEGWKAAADELRQQRERAA